MTNQNARQEELRAKLIDIATLLEGIGESGWATKASIAAAARTIDVDEVFSWYGGMGSFNDLVISGLNGHRVERAHESALNTKLDELREMAFKLASSIRGS
jgi:hypothetical protein